MDFVCPSPKEAGPAPQIMDTIVLVADSDKAALKSLVDYLQQAFKIKPEQLEIAESHNFKFAVRYTPRTKLDTSTEHKLTDNAEGFLAGWKRGKS